jgi:AraC-like DNA-binding protein
MRGRVTDPERFCELFQRALNLYSGGQPEKTGALRARGAVLDLLVWLFSTTKSAPGARGDAESIRDARDILRDLAMKPFSQASSIRELFEGRGLGYDHHARLFRQVHGLTPLQYVNQIRVDRAKRLLMDSTMSVKEIAENLGFRDSPYLVRLFKKTTGASPGEFRARAKSSDSPSVTSVSTKGIPSDAQ